jgi:hypothetical protein
MENIPHIKIGITGHQRLSEPLAWAWVESAIRQELENRKPSTTQLIGVSSLAIGADQLFARCVLETGGSLIAVIPFPDYIRTFETQENKECYESLKKCASEVIILPHDSDDQSAYLAAGKLVVETSDLLFAIWDGQPAKGKGGTGDAVEFALKNNKSVVHINPDSKTVLELSASS